MSAASRLRLLAARVDALPRATDDDRQMLPHLARRLRTIAHCTVRATGADLADLCEQAVAYAEVWEGTSAERWWRAAARVLGGEVEA